MTKKQYKRVCRIKVERLAKIITFIFVLSILSLGSIFNLDGYVVATLSTFVWFFAPDAAAYILENKYKIKHYHTYR